MDKSKQEQTPPFSGFDLFWSRYPTKFNRAHAQAVWDDIDPTPAQQEAFLGALTIEAGDRERARHAGRKLPTPTGALWLIEHRHLGVEHSNVSLLQPMRAATIWLRARWSAFRCGGSVQHADYTSAAMPAGDSASRGGICEIDGCERGIFVCTRSRVTCESCPRLKAHRELLTAWNHGHRDHQAGRAGTRPSDLTDRDGERAQVDDLNTHAVAAPEKAVHAAHSQSDAIGTPVAPRVEHPQHSADYCDGERGGLDVVGVHKPAILSVAARYRRHGALPRHASTVRRLVERTAQATFMVALPITLAAMAFHGWTAP